MSTMNSSGSNFGPHERLGNLAFPQPDGLLTTVESLPTIIAKYR